MPGTLVRGPEPALPAVHAHPQRGGPITPWTPPAGLPSVESGTTSSGGGPATARRKPVFIQIIQGRCSRQDELHALADRWREELGPTADGWLGGTYGFTDDDTFLGIVRFESREAAMRNSRRPEQQAWAEQMAALVDGELEYHDCDDVTLLMGGGSDDAGFVQVIRGKVDDVDRLRTMMTSDTDTLHRMRPRSSAARWPSSPTARSPRRSRSATRPAPGRASRSSRRPRSWTPCSGRCRTRPTTTCTTPGSARRADPGAGPPQAGSLPPEAASSRRYAVGRNRSPYRSASCSARATNAARPIRPSCS